MQHYQLHQGPLSSWTRGLQEPVLLEKYDLHHQKHNDLPLHRLQRQSSSLAVALLKTD